MFEHSPLFRAAVREIQQLARREFARTAVGRLVQEAQAAVRFGSVARGGLEAAMAQYARRGGRRGVGDALRQLRGMSFGHFAAEVERYARGANKRLVDEFLERLGPAGKLIKALVGSGTTLRDELEVMGRLLREFGYDVRPPSRAKTASGPGTAAAARELLESLGWQVVPPGEELKPKRPAPPGPGQARPKQPPFVFGEERVAEVRVGKPAAAFRGRWPADHPVFTGEMVPVQSSNVHSIGYDIDSQFLYVRFLGYVRGQKGPDGHALRAGPGPLYRYRPVLPDEFVDFLAASSKGNWVWDHLRVRGTWSGHWKNYELAGVTGQYVPRAAMRLRDPRTGRMEEWFVQRTITTLGGQRLTSRLPTERAGPLPEAWGQPDRPDSAEPDRPFDARPD